MLTEDNAESGLGGALLELLELLKGYFKAPSLQRLWKNTLLTHKQSHSSTTQSLERPAPSRHKAKYPCATSLEWWSNTELYLYLIDLQTLRLLAHPRSLPCAAAVLFFVVVSALAGACATPF